MSSPESRFRGRHTKTYIAVPPWLRPDGRRSWSSNKPLCSDAASREALIAFGVTFMRHGRIKVGEMHSARAPCVKGHTRFAGGFFTKTRFPQKMISLFSHLRARTLRGSGGCTFLPNGFLRSGSGVTGRPPLLTRFHRPRALWGKLWGRSLSFNACFHIGLCYILIVKVVFVKWVIFHMLSVKTSVRHGHPAINESFEAHGCFSHLVRCAGQALNELFTMEAKLS